MFVRKADDIPQGNIQLLKNDRVHAISQQVFTEKSNIYDWLKNKTENINSSYNIQQMSLFD